MKRGVPNSLRFSLLLLFLALLGLVVWSGCGRDSVMGPEDEANVAPLARGEAVVLSADDPRVVHVMALQEASTPDFFRDPNIVGTATGVDAAGEPAILLFVVDESQAAAPSTLDGVPVVVQTTGRLVARKGLDVLLDALALLGGGPPLPALAVAGYGDDSSYRAQAAHRGLADRIHFLGAVPDPDLPRLYRAADLAAMPSRTRAGGTDVEGFGLVYLEAAASGLPVVAGRTGGAPGRMPYTYSGDSATPTTSSRRSRPLSTAATRSPKRSPCAAANGPFTSTSSGRFGLG